MKRFVIIFLVISQLNNIKCELKPLECLPQVARMQAITFCQFSEQSSKNRDVSRIKPIPSMFQGQYINTSRVDVISIVNCDFDRIPTSIYKNFGPIKWIRILYSNITSLRNEDFIPATNLKKLEIEDSKIGMISSKAFEFSKNLEEIDIKNCDIGSFTNDAFDGLKNLKTVNLKGNKYGQYAPNFNELTINVISS